MYSCNLVYHPLRSRWPADLVKPGHTRDVMRRPCGDFYEAKTIQLIQGVSPRSRNHGFIRLTRCSLGILGDDNP